MDAVKKKLQNALKLSGFIVRSELCKLIVEKLSAENINLENKTIFDLQLKNICTNLEKLCLLEKSIEKEHILQVIEGCLQPGYDKNETIFSVVSAFNFPNLTYDNDRKIYVQSNKKLSLLPKSESKTELFKERYYLILQRVRRHFKQIPKEEVQFTLQTVDYLLTKTEATLEKILILGSLLLVSEGKYYLEDLTGMLPLDLTYANYDKGFFVENCFVLVNGQYEDKTLQVATVILPPGENYKESRIPFGNINYFGGSSLTPLRDSIRLKQLLQSDKNAEFFLLSDVWLDHPLVFEKLQIIFEGMEPNPPVCFIFMGNFMIDSLGSEKLENLKKLFKKLSDLLSQYTNIVNNSHFIFIPGLEDPSTPHIVPRFALPSILTNTFSKSSAKVTFATNPCRIQYCNREIVAFRADILAKLMQGTIKRPKKEHISESVIKTILSQGHLSPLPLNSLPVYWDFDFTLRLNPLPDLIIIGDKSDPYQGLHHDCIVTNPGSFCENNFNFCSYNPYSNTVNTCEL